MSRDTLTATLTLLRARRRSLAKRNLRIDFNLVRAAGIEPAWPRPRDFKSLASTSFATPATAAFCHFPDGCDRAEACGCDVTTTFPLPPLFAPPRDDRAQPKRRQTETPRARLTLAPHCDRAPTDERRLSSRRQRLLDGARVNRGTTAACSSIRPGWGVSRSVCARSDCRFARIGARAARDPPCGASHDQP